MSTFFKPVSSYNVPTIYCVNIEYARLKLMEVKIVQRYVKIIGSASSICWWIDCVGQICPVLEVYESTGYIKIQVARTEFGFEDKPFKVEGWIDPQYVEETVTITKAEYESLLCDKKYLDTLESWQDKDGWQGYTEARQMNEEDFEKEMDGDKSVR